MKKFNGLWICLLFIFPIAVNANTAVHRDMLGYFNPQKDLLLTQFDSKTDVDDIHTIAAVATMLRDPAFKQVHYHAVAGAYGTQGGGYVPSPELFNMAFGDNWSDAHTNWDKALNEVVAEVSNTLTNGGDIWIVEAGQSDFSAAMLKAIQAKKNDINTLNRIHIVQHSGWNQDNTTPAALQYVKTNSDYHKIADGNAVGNGTPGFLSKESRFWQRALNNKRVGAIWQTARKIANQYNGTPTRYKNEAIAGGGFDFSDASEMCWIFGFNDLSDVSAFFDRFL